jgi:hypothetical protein
MISWEPLKEGHCRGQCSRGRVWIRLDREGRVSGLYTLFGETVKYVPETEEELGLEAMQLRAEIVLAHHDWAEELAINNKNSTL